MSPKLTSCKVALALLIATAGCASEAGVPTGNGSARDKLAETMAMPIMEDGAELRMVGRVDSEGEPIQVEVRINAGWLVLRAQPDGALVAEAVEFSVDDIVLGETTGSLEGIHLTNVRVALAEPAVLESDWLAGDHGVIGTGQVAVELNWSMVTSRGDVIEMTPQIIEGIDLSVHAYMTADDELAVDIAAGHSGVFWEWARIAELSDLDLEAAAHEG